MIKAIKKVSEAYANYNPITGKGAHELLKALAHYHVKDREVEEALERVQKIFDEKRVNA